MFFFFPCDEVILVVYFMSWRDEVTLGNTFQSDNPPTCCYCRLVVIVSVRLLLGYPNERGQSKRGSLAVRNALSSQTPKLQCAKLLAVRAFPATACTQYHRKDTSGNFLSFFPTSTYLPTYSTYDFTPPPVQATVTTGYFTQDCVLFDSAPYTEIYQPTILFLSQCL